jgi:hypothetical protein
MFTWGKLFAEAAPRLVTSLYYLYATKVQYEPDRTEMYRAQLVTENGTDTGVHWCHVVEADI